MITSVTEWEPKLRQAVVKWMDELSDAVDKNGGEPVTWDYKKLQDRFRGFDCSYTAILEALRNKYFIEITQVDGRRQFSITDCGWTFLVNEKYSKLRLLLSDRIARERKRSTIAKRKTRRKAYADPTMRLIDDFRYGVKFDHKELLKQLRRDRDTPSQMSRKAIKVDGELHSHTSTPIANIRFQSVLHPLLAFETRKFCPLIRDERGLVYHEFMSLPRQYRRFASVQNKPYIDGFYMQEYHPELLERIHDDLFPNVYSFGESLGLIVVYEQVGLSFFADRNDPELSAKQNSFKDYLRALSAKIVDEMSLGTKKFPTIDRV